MRRDEAYRERLRALVEGRLMGSGAPSWRLRRPLTKGPLTTKTSPMQGNPTMGAAGFEPATSRV
jgi:hypothetical protein